MSFRLRLALAQINPTVGDMGHNAKAILGIAQTAKEQSVDFLVFPELCLCGYPPEDLLHKPSFLADNEAALQRLASELSGLTAVVGFAQPSRKCCYNAAAVIRGGKIESIYQKGLLPNYGVFDEKRYFAPGQTPVVIEHGPMRIAVTICEDIWDLHWLDRFLDGHKSRLDLIVTLSASPFNAGKIQERQQVLARCSRHFNCAAAYCNLVGGQDELVFDGRSMIVNAQGSIAAQAKEFEEDLCIADIEHTPAAPPVVHPISSSLFSAQPVNVAEEVWQALVLGTRDYVRKNGFSKAVIGLSGGIDSALVAAIAAEALGPGNVIGITLPSRFNAAETRNDARTLAGRLGIDFYTVPIADILDVFSRTLGTLDGWNEQGLAYENLQARIRGTILMSYSNRFGWMVLTTGNKSETAVGYSTLYGDTAGGFAVIKDVPKTLVYKLCKFVNDRAGRLIIPETIIARPPSAELRSGQKDTDSLPDYDLLDAILKNYVELDHSAAELIQNGFPEDQVRRIINLVDKSEYKRRQSPPGIKITPRAFGKDRRMPITNRYNP
ncbi:MAG: NAD+ synthase [Planctomycetales bacterium]|nr:NAD+ synthase [Planctomycetales bacterium]